MFCFVFPLLLLFHINPICDRVLFSPNRVLFYKIDLLTYA